MEIYIWNAAAATNVEVYYCNETFNETVITWSNQFTGVTVGTIGGNCSLAGTIVHGGGGGYETIDLTSGISEGYTIGRDNFTIVLASAAEDNSNDVIGVRTKEHGTAAQIHSLNITYQAAAGADTTFQITATDIYDNTTINNLSVILFNSSTTITNSTQSGTLTFHGLGGLMNLNISSNQSGTYFNKTYYNVDVSSNLAATLFQSVLNLYVNDTLTGKGLSSFTVGTNYSSFSGTDGYILLYSKTGSNHALNITSIQYPLHQFTYSINAVQNLSMTVNLSPSFQFYLRREADNSVFDVGSTNSTRLKIYCPNNTVEIVFKNATYNSTQENYTATCPYSLMKMDVSYSDSSYFRSLVPDYSQQNVTWHLLDLNLDTGVQKILQLVDLTGDWSNGLIRLVTGVGGTNVDIIEQYFDVSTAVTLYLLKDALYTLSIENNDGTQERQLGTLVADTAGTVTITYPNIEFYPESSILEDNVSWSYTCPFSQCIYPYNTSASILRLRYIDTSGNTDSIAWTIYNGSNTSNILQTFSSTSQDVTFTYQPVYKNQTYTTLLFVQHSDLSHNITDIRTFGDYELQTPPGFTAAEARDYAFYLSMIFLMIWGLVFSAQHSGIGLASTFALAVFFKLKGWLPLNRWWIALIGFAAAVGFIYESIKKD